MGAAVLDDPRARHDWQVVECGGRAREGGCRRMGRALGGRMRGRTDVVEKRTKEALRACAPVWGGSRRGAVMRWDCMTRTEMSPLVAHDVTHALPTTHTELVDASYTLGRHSSCNRVFHDPVISNTHCCIFRVGEGGSGSGSSVLCLARPLCHCTKHQPDQRALCSGRTSQRALGPRTTRSRSSRTGGWLLAVLQNCRTRVQPMSVLKLTLLNLHPPPPCKSFHQFKWHFHQRPAFG